MDGELPLDLPVHPLADIFPMLDDDELADLAADIEAHGLQNPIMLDAAGEVLVDGRNRLAACKIAGVEPTFDRLRDGKDPKTFIVSQNLQRRNLTKGQQAMALAMIYPEPTPGKRTDLSGDGTGLEGVSKQRLSVARAVLRMGPDDLAPLVLSGLKTLDVAFAEAWRRRDEATSEEAQHARLHAEAPDLADLVAEESLSLSEAFAVFEQREAEKAAVETQKRETLLRLTEAAYRGVSAWANSDFAYAVQSRLDDPQFRKQLVERLRIEGEGEDIQAGARALKKMLGKIR